MNGFKKGLKTDLISFTVSSTENVSTVNSSENISSLSANVDKMNFQTETASEGTGSDAGYSSLLSTEDLTRPQPFSGGNDTFSLFCSKVYKFVCRRFAPHASVQFFVSYLLSVILSLFNSLC